MVTVVVFARACQSVCNKTLTHILYYAFACNKSRKNRWKDFSNDRLSVKKRKASPEDTFKNCYAEEDYIAVARNFTEPTQLAMLHNLVGTCTLKSDQPLDLRVISNFLPNSIYHAAKFCKYFACVVMRCASVLIV